MFRFLFRRSGRVAIAGGIGVATVLGLSAVAGASPAKFKHHGGGHARHHGADGAWDHGNGGRDHGMGRTLYVSPSGAIRGADRSCASAGFSTIQSAVNAAAKGGTVIVCSGTYHENVVVSAPLTLVGQDATIQAVPTPNGTCSFGPCLSGVTITSSYVEIEGFTVTGAVGEGILAVGSPTAGSISHVTITHNQVTGNDVGGIPPATGGGYPQCEAAQGIPGDCGEGIHLASVTDSIVSHNYDSGNTGGILVTDEFGPTHGNVIESNIVTKNQFDCGITMPGHNPNAVSATGIPQPTVAGVYNNVVRGNIVTDNGLLGEGAGVLFANATAGTGSYNNLVENNYIAGNGLSGVTMHAHTVGPGQFEDMSGNTVIHNVIGENNLLEDGDPLDGSQSDPSTTGILVFSGAVAVTETIAHNTIFGNTYGIWEGVGGHVTLLGGPNLFLGNGTDVFTQP
jgi:hypothetical protein